MGVLTTRPVRIPVSGMVKVPVIIPTRSFFGEIQLELDNPPAGLSIDSVALSGPGSVIVLRSEADEVERGLKGNLIVNVFAEKTGEDPAKGRNNARSGASYSAPCRRSHLKSQNADKYLQGLNHAHPLSSRPFC